MGSDKRAGEEVPRERKELKTNCFDFKMLLRWAGARVKAASGGLLCVRRAVGFV